MDVLVLTTMKNAAKCDTKSELQNPVNLYVFERMLRFRVLLEACLFECLFSPLAFSCFGRARGLWTSNFDSEFVGLSGETTRGSLTDLFLSYLTNVVRRKSTYNVWDTGLKGRRV